MKRKILAGVLAAAMVCSLTYVGPAKADTEAKETIASLDYVYSDAGDVEVDPKDATVSDLNKEKYGNKDDGYKFTTGEARLFASITGEKSRTLEWCQDNDEIAAVYKMESGGEEVKETEPVMTASKKNPWTEGTTPYFEVRMSTEGYEDVDFSAYVGATNKGPKDYRLSYAVGDAESFTPLEGEEAALTLAKNKKMTKIAGTLPEAADGQANVRVRIEIATLETVDQKAASGSAVMLTDNSTSGEAAINHIAVMGRKKAGGTSGTATATPAATTAVTQKPVVPDDRTIASLDYGYQDESDVEVDANDAAVSDLNVSRYGDATNGYAFTTGDAKLFASVTGDKNKTLEWSKNSKDKISPEYKMTVDGAEVDEVEPVMASTKKNPWTAGTTPYFEVQFSAEGYENVDFSAYVGATNKGPKDYRLSYAVGDAESFVPLEGEEAALTLTKNKKMTKIAGNLPEAADDQAKVRVRIEIATLETVDQKAASGSAVMLIDNPTKGEAAVNHIAVKGEKKGGGTPEPGASAPAAASPTKAATKAPVQSSATPVPTAQTPTKVPTAPENGVISSLDYSYQDAGDVEVDASDATVSDLNVSRYGDKKNGYAFTTGSARLFASVTGDKTKTLEWSKDGDDKVSPEYKMTVDGTEVDEVEPVMASTKKNPWTKDTVPYFEVQFSTAGREKVSFSAYVGATKKGPKDYQLSYAVGDATQFTRLEDEGAKIELTENKKMTKIAGTLPEAAANQQNVRVRIEIVSLQALDQSGAAAGTPAMLTDNPTKGEAAINHIVIKADAQPGVTLEPVSSATAKPTVTPVPTPVRTPSFIPTLIPDTPNPPAQTAETTDEPQATQTGAAQSTAPAQTTAPAGGTAAASSAPVMSAAPSSSPSVEKGQGTKKIVVKKLKLNKKKITIKKGKKYQLKVSFQVSGTSKAKIKNALKWTSSNKKVAAVTKKGKIKAKKKGKARITVKYKKLKATCRVTVK